MKKDWERITINLSPSEYGDLKILASLRKESVAAFIRHLLKIHLEINQPLAILIRDIKEAGITKSS